MQATFVWAVRSAGRPARTKERRMRRAATVVKIPGSWQRLRLAFGPCPPAALGGGGCPAL